MVDVHHVHISVFLEVLLRERKSLLEEFKDLLVVFNAKLFLHPLEDRREQVVEEPLRNSLNIRKGKLLDTLFHQH